MAYVAITSDLHGYVFSIDHTGDLFRNRELTPNGGALAYPGLGERIGSGWADVRHLAATRIAEQLVLAGSRDRGVSVLASTPVSELDRWVGVVPIPGTQAWGDLLHLCGGTKGSVYAVTTDGALRLHAFSAGAGPTVVMAPPVELAHSGWAAVAGGGPRLTLLTNGTRFFDVTFDGELRYQSTPIGGSLTTPNTGWVVLSGGWTRYQRVLAGAPSYLYGIASEGALVVHRFAEERETVRMLPRTAADTIGAGIVGWPILPCAVEGYATPQQGAPGDVISFHTAAHTFSPVKPIVEPSKYTVEYLRLRRLDDGKKGGHDIVGHEERTFRTETRKLPEDWLCSGAQWPVTFTYTIPKDTRSGLYAARCVDDLRHDFFIPFIVRPRQRSAPFAVLANTNTWNAYNCWGGYGKYVHRHPLPHTIPFERPHPGLTPEIPDDSVSTELFNQTGHLLRAELWVLGWLDSLGSDYSYDLYTDRDLHDGIPELADPVAANRYKALILTVHPEYWTAQMYDAAKAYQDLGGSILYLGGNGLYEEVWFEPSGVGLTIFPGVDLSKIKWCETNADVRVQCLWRNRGRPERAIIGVGFDEDSGAEITGQPYQLVLDPSRSPALKDVDLPVGAQLGATSANPGHMADGWEVDVRGKGSPAAAYGPEALLALGAYVSKSGEMLYYETGSGGVVFAGSSLDFGGSLAVDPNLQRIVRNVLDITRTRQTLR